MLYFYNILIGIKILQIFCGAHNRNIKILKKKKTITNDFYLSLDNRPIFFNINAKKIFHIALASWIK